MDVAQKIRLFLCHAGISQTYLSEKTGISKIKLELTLAGKQRFTFDEYEAICKALGVGVETFLEARPPVQKEKAVLHAKCTER